MNYEIVFCDVDGTLLNNEHRMEDRTSCLYVLEDFVWGSMN